jgi:hypothetical protein
VEIREGRRVVYSLHAHLVFVTKRRGKVFGAAHLKASGGNLSVCLRRLRGGVEGVQRRNGPRPLADRVSPEGSPVRTGQQSQGRVRSAHEAGIPGDRHVLERPQEQGTPLVSELLRGICGWRAADYSPAVVHRWPESAFGRCRLIPRHKFRGTSGFLVD